ncbi:MAG TPA: hypothetical protein GXX28_09065, partial [Firmicutes bacterium]|nr:hypothetical protein [Bacillota bacterium]
MAEEMERWEPMRLHFYTKPGDKFPRTWAHTDKAQCTEYRPESIIVEKVFNECSVVECPVIVRFTNIPAGAGNVSDCVVLASRVINARILAENVVEFTIEWLQRIVFDTTTRTEVFRFTKRVRLEGADPDMFGSRNLDFVPFVQCLNCRVVSTPTGNVIECEVGIFVVVKLIAYVQLEIERARFTPMPPECEQISPIGCPDF